MLGVSLGSYNGTALYSSVGLFDGTKDGMFDELSLGEKLLLLINL